jgi:hypothetical protein
MITFKQFVAEAPTLTPEEAAEKVFADCKTFITEFNPRLPQGIGSSTPSGVLYRAMGEGFSGLMSEFSGDRVRKPKDSLPDLHALLDEHFIQHFGFPFRSRGVFCATSKTQASNYGQPQLLFPVGKFKYVYSDIVTDAYVMFQGSKKYNHAELYDDIIDDLKDTGVLEDILSAEELSSKANTRKALDDFDKWFECVTAWLEQQEPYISDGLADYVHGKGSRESTEVMLSCKKYYLIDPSSPDFERFAKRFNQLSNE